MTGWMYGWIDGWIVELMKMDEWMDGEMDVSLFGWMNE